MPTVVGVKLRFAARVLSFDPAGLDCTLGDAVIVQTERGEELGEVVEVPHDVAVSDLAAPLKPVLRAASEAELDRDAEARATEGEALAVFRDLVKQHKLDMKPVNVEMLIDGGKMIFYFAAEERVDFRELVRELASRFKVRIDMRQIGVRDEARMVGGLGHCGQQLCCDRFTGDFQPVSIRMAKEQDLPLNPLKISGLCGRLMCCLRYEYDAYKDFKSRAPKRGAMVETPVGEGKVVDLNTPKETVTIRVPEAGTTLTVPLSTMECCKGQGCPCSVNREALEEAGVALPASMSAPARELSESPRREGGRSSRRGGSGKPAPQAAPPQGEPKRRSRSGAEGKKSGRKSEAPKAEESAGKAKGAAPAEAQGEAQAAKPAGRRRRRRRPSGGAGKDSAQ